MWRRWRGAIGCLLAAVSLCACDPSALLDTPPGICTEAGVQCQLETGPLGVCERAPCDAGRTAPCFRCTPQH